MADPKELANKARTTLSQALGALQSGDDIPDALLDIAEPIAKTMGVLHRVERTGTGSIAEIDQALDNVRNALDSLQQVGVDHPAVDEAMEAVAGSLSKMFALSKALKATPSQPSPEPVPSPAPKPLAAIHFAETERPPVTRQPSVKVDIKPQAQPPAAVHIKPRATDADRDPSWSAPEPRVKPHPQAQEPIHTQFGTVVMADEPRRPAHAQFAQTEVMTDPDPQPQQKPQQRHARQSHAQPQPTVQGQAQRQPQPQPQQAQPQPAHAPRQAQPQPKPQPQQPPEPQPRRSPAHPQPAAAEPPPIAATPRTSSAAAPQAVVAEPAQDLSKEKQRVPGMGDAPLPSESTPRFDVDLGAHSGSNFYKGLSGNDVIDHGGIFVATFAKMPNVGHPVSLRVHLPGDLDFDGDAIVQWTREVRSGESDPGFGARFTRISPEGRQLVYRYVRNREPMFYDDL